MSVLHSFPEVGRVGLAGLEERRDNAWELNSKKFVYFLGLGADSCQERSVQSSVHVQTVSVKVDGLKAS